MTVLVMNKGSDKVPLKTIDRIKTSPTSGSENEGMVIELVRPYTNESDELVAVIVGAWFATTVIVIGKLTTMVPIVSVTVEVDNPNAVPRGGDIIIE